MGNTLYAILIFIVLGKSSSAQGETERDLDAFMSKVLKKREVNWEALHGYFFSETETLEIKGLRLPPTFNFKREYVWIVRDGHHPREAEVFARYRAALRSVQQR